MVRSFSIFALVFTYCYLLGIRTAQIRAIFKLPSHYGSFPHPLAYVEWFRPFTKPDAQSGLYRLARSTRDRRRFAAVISVQDIYQACHLSPRLGSKEMARDSGWVPGGALEQCEDFFLNTYINFYLFHTIEQMQYDDLQ